MRSSTDRESTRSTRAAPWRAWAYLGASALLALVAAGLNWRDPLMLVLALNALALCGLAAYWLRLLRRLRHALRSRRRATRAAEDERGETSTAFDTSLLSEASALDSALPAERPARGSVRLRVLVAEDHDVNRQYLAALLERLGHEAQFVANGVQAVRAVQQADDLPFDVVLMDLAMPELDGVAATQKIRALHDSRRATLPVVALTADETPQTRGRCLVAGMNDFLTKPINGEALAACLRRLFGDEAVQPRPAAAAGDAPSVLDLHTLNAVLAALPRERVVELLRAFFGDAPSRLQRLREAVREARTQELKVDAHGMRGAALNLGLGALAATAGALHDGASHLAAHEVALLLQRLEQQVMQSRRALANLGLAS